MNFTPLEQRGWREHFNKYPLGDFYTQKLLADLLCMIAKALGGKDSQPRDYAPWLYPDEVEIEEPSPEEDLRLKSLQQIVDLNSG